MLVCLVIGATAVGACKTNSISATTNNESDAIGPAGGSLTGSNGEKLIVPAGALSATTVFDLSVAQPAAGGYPQDPPSGLTFAGNVFEYQPHGIQFATPATVVVPYGTTVTSPVLLHAEEGDTTWTMLDVTGSSTVDVGGTSQNALESAVSTLSYFVVAGSTGGANSDSGTNSCSGRSPLASAPTGTVSNFTGSLGGGTATIDLTKIVDGIAAPVQGTPGGWQFLFTQYSGACGYIENADGKASAQDLNIEITGVTTLSVQTYPATQSDAFIVTNSTTCGGSSGGVGGSSSGTGITIEAVDSSHVQGSFDFTPPGASTPISGTFDLPICTAPTDLTFCCLQ